MFIAHPTDSSLLGQIAGRAHRFLPRLVLFATSSTTEKSSCASSCVGRSMAVQLWVGGLNSQRIQMVGGAKMPGIITHMIVVWVNNTDQLISTHTCVHTFVDKNPPTSKLCSSLAIQSELEWQVSKIWCWRWVLLPAVYCNIISYIRALRQQFGIPMDST